MDHETAKELADGYRAFLVSGDGGVFRMFSDCFFDNVSGRPDWKSFRSSLSGWTPASTSGQLTFIS